MENNYIVSLADIDNKIDYHEKEILKLKNAKEVFDSLKKIAPSASVKSERIPAKINRSTSGKTFKEVIASIFKKEDKLFTTRELYNLFLAKTGKNLSYNTFSGQFSGLVKNNRDIFKNIMFPENPINTRFYYGLIVWFEGNDLKPEYRSKI